MNIEEKTTTKYLTINGRKIANVYITVNKPELRGYKIGSIMYIEMDKVPAFDIMKKIEHFYVETTSDEAIIQDLVSKAGFEDAEIKY